MKTQKNVIGKKLQIASNTNKATNRELIQHLIAKEVVKSKVLKIAGEMFVQYEK